MTTTEAAEPQIPPPGNNVFSRIAGVLFAPAETFQDIVRRPGILWPLLLFVAIGFFSSMVMAPRLDFDSIKAEQAKQLKKRNIPDSDIERFQNIAIATAKVGVWLNPLLMIVLYVVAAAIVFFAFRLMGGEGTFVQAFAVTLYAWIPLVLYSLILDAVVLVHGTFDPVTVATLVKSNPAFLVDPQAQPVLFALLSSFDLFSFWWLFLLIVGFAVLSKLSRATSAGIVLTLWLVIVLLRLGLAAMRA